MRRSSLYVPGDRPDRFAKAADSGADAIILDLEDAVAVSAKDEARSHVARFLTDTPRGAGPQRLVRLNSESFAADLDALAGADVDAFSLAKASLDGLDRLDDHLGDREVPVVALIETAADLENLGRIAKHHRVESLAVGEADLTAELGITPSVDEHELWPLRMQLVVASAAAQIAPPTAPVSTDFKDPTALALSTALMRRAGFGGRACIHPAQVSVVNDVFTPTDDEVADARRLVEMFDAAVAAGSGVATDDDGRMIDEAVVRQARRLL
jgi:citrate lyase subunit beta/citryl-CoA lyase